MFNALLGGSEPVSGFMEAAVTGAKESHQRYLPNTAILETIVDGTGGTMRIVDAYHPIDKLRAKGLLPEQVAIR